MCCLSAKRLVGNPKTYVDIQVKCLLAIDFQLDEVDATCTLDVSRSTLYRHMKDPGIEKYSDITDTDLNNTIRRIKQTTLMMVKFNACTLIETRNSCTYSAKKCNSLYIKLTQRTPPYDGLTTTVKR